VFTSVLVFEIKCFKEAATFSVVITTSFKLAILVAALIAFLALRFQ